MAFDPSQPEKPGQHSRPVRRTGEPRRPGQPGTGSNLPARRSDPRRKTPDQRRAVPHRRSSSGRKEAYKPRYADKNQKSLSLPLLILIGVLAIGAVTALGFGIHALTNKNPETPEILETQVPETTLPELPHVVDSATVYVTGDLLPHKTIYSKGSVVYQEEQSYNFDPVFKFLKGYTDTADFAVANLETTLYGPEKAYSGNPNFNTPDQIVDGAKKAGFDLLLTANNHCNDTGIDGVLRTVQVIRDRGLTALGTNLTEEEPRYYIADLNGIRIGMLCYTYEDSQNPNVVTFNYNPLPQDKNNLVCSFPLFEQAKSREPFYTEVMAQIREMREQGAEAIVMFLHWGQEYHLEPSQDQRSMAQSLCDLGVDLIVGGHPHVVEPVELLSSTMDPHHKTVCLYSLGNAFSNQRREEMTSQKSGHTEDGMLFTFTFDRYSDGKVRLGNVNVIPTWVDKHSDAEGKREYNILPLEDSRRSEWQTMFSIDDATCQKAAESYDRTMAIVGPGLEVSNQWINEMKPHREELPMETQSMEAAS